MDREPDRIVTEAGRRAGPPPLEAYFTEHRLMGAEAGTRFLAGLGLFFAFIGLIALGSGFSLVGFVPILGGLYLTAGSVWTLSITQGLSEPVLRFDAEGFRDRRIMPRSIAWSAVREVGEVFQRGGPFAIGVWLHDAARAEVPRASRLAALLWGGTTAELYITVALLDHDAEDIRRSFYDHWDAARGMYRHPGVAPLR